MAKAGSVECRDRIFGGLLSVPPSAEDSEDCELTVSVNFLGFLGRREERPLLSGPRGDDVVRDFVAEGLGEPSNTAREERSGESFRSEALPTVALGGFPLPPLPLVLMRRSPGGTSPSNPAVTPSW